MSRLMRSASSEDHAQGSLDAPLVMVEYGDFECPYCGEAYPVLKAVQQAMGDDLCFVFRHFPLSEAHPHAERAAEFAEAAATIGKFWEMHDILYENQQALTDQSLVIYGKKLGLPEKLMESALSEGFATRVRRDFISGARSGVNGTPCLFINDTRYDGPRDAESLIEVLRTTLGRRVI
jgi:protein-disulfide isomerase